MTTPFFTVVRTLKYKALAERAIYALESERLTQYGLGGQTDNVYAYTTLDIFSKEPSVVIAPDLKMETGAKAFAMHHKFYGRAELHQSDNDSEVQSDFEAVVENASKHR